MDASLFIPLLAAGLMVLLLRWLGAARARRRLRRRMTLPYGPRPRSPKVVPWTGEVPLWVWYRANRRDPAPRPQPWRPRPRRMAQ